MRKLSSSTIFCVRILCVTVTWVCLVSAIAFAQGADVPASTPEENTIFLRSLAEQEYQQAEWAFERVTQDIMDLADENAALDVEFTGNASQDSDADWKDSDAHEHHEQDSDADWKDSDAHEHHGHDDDEHACHEEHGEPHWQEDGDVHECHKENGEMDKKQDTEMLKEDTENEIR